MQYRDDGYALGRWINKQRSAFGRGDLDPEREKRLAALPGWTWDVNEADWEESFARLLAYVEREGSARVPSGYKQDGFALGLWVSAQRSLLTRGKLDPERRRRLAALPGWTWQALQTKWDEGFARLSEYVEREGTAQLPQSHVEDGFALGRWVSKQRGAFARGTLDSERQSRLAALAGWTWQPDEDRWQEGFVRLSDYVRREGSARIPSGYEEDGFALGRWVVTRRREFRAGKLDPKRQQHLMALRGWTWNTFETGWDEGFAYLSKYVQREGNARVPVGYEEDGFSLGAWVKGQRATFAKGTLAAQRAARLRSMPGWTWHTKEDAWEEAFDRLSQYVQRERSAFVPTGHEEDGFRLGQWVAVQRRNFAKGKLDRRRQKLLAALPGWTWDALEAKWEEGFERLSVYVQREGSAHVPGGYEDDGFRLGQWISVQRSRFAKRRARTSAQEALGCAPRLDLGCKRGRMGGGL